MTQKARPVAPDVSIGNWTIVPLYQKINEPNFDDNTLITSGNNPAGDACEVRLAVLSWPQNTALGGSQTLTLRLKKTDVSPLGVSVALVQGSNIVAARNFQPTQNFAPYDITLTALEIARITDYTNLRVRVTAGRIPTNCCPNGLPATLFATFANITGGCSCLPSEPLALTYNGVYWTWLGSFCGKAANFSVFCIGNTCQSFQLFGLYDVMPTYPDPGCSCNPLRLSYTISSTRLCSGTYKVIVTE